MAAQSLPETVLRETNLVGALREAAKAFSDRPAQIFKDEKGNYTQRRTLPEFEALARRAASGLLSRGFPEGGRAGILAENRPEWNIADFAVMMNGGATVGIYTNDNEDDIRYKINDANLWALFVDGADKLERLRRIPRGEIAPLKRVFVFDNLPGEDDFILPFTSLTEAEDAGGALDARIRAVTADTLCRVVYTSGTSGRPKGAMLIHRNLLSNVIASSERLSARHDDVVISYLPDAHILQSMVDYMFFLNGGALGYSHKKTLREDMIKLRPTIFPGVPRVFRLFLDGIADAVSRMSGGKITLGGEGYNPVAMAPMVKAAAGMDRVRIFVSGAAKLDLDVFTRLRDLCGITVFEGYGLSETSPVIALSTPEENRPGTVGKILGNLKVRIVDEEGRSLPPNERGEVVVTGPSVFAGYLNQPEQTRKALTEKGEFFTGDRGMIDFDGYLTVFGRKGHRVKFANGEYYDLETIAEKFLGGARLIGQAAVAGEQRDYCVAVIGLSEDLEAARRFADAAGIAFDDPYSLVYHEKVIDAVREEFYAIRQLSGKDNPVEVVRKAIYIRPFSPDNQESTTTAKTRIRYITDKYAPQIDALYVGGEDFVVLKTERFE